MSQSLENQKELSVAGPVRHMVYTNTWGVGNAGSYMEKSHGQTSGFSFLYFPFCLPASSPPPSLFSLPLPDRALL